MVEITIFLGWLKQILGDFVPTLIEYSIILVNFLIS